MTPDEQRYVREVLQDVPGLTDAGPSVLDALAVWVRLRLARSGEWICREGDAGESLFILGYGGAEVVKNSVRGRPFVVAELTPGVLFGHVAVITEGVRTAGIRAKGDTTLLEISAADVRHLVDHEDMALGSPFRRALIVALARQLHSATATTMQLAVDAGISEKSTIQEADSVEHAATNSRLGELPEDTQERLERARSLV